MALSVYARLGTSTLAGSGQTAKSHTVKGGEAMSAIAAFEFNEGYNSESWRQIAEYNNIDDLDAVTTNMVLAIPPPQASIT